MITKVSYSVKPFGRWLFLGYHSAHMNFGSKMARPPIPGKKQLTANLLGKVYRILKEDALEKGYLYNRSGAKQPRWGDYFKAIALGIVSGDINVPHNIDKSN